jgi:hypothetical protein
VDLIVDDDVHDRTIRHFFRRFKVRS